MKAESADARNEQSYLTSKLSQFNVKQLIEKDLDQLKSFLLTEPSKYVENRKPAMLERAAQCGHLLSISDDEEKLAAVSGAFQLTDQIFELGSTIVCRPKNAGAHRLLIALRVLLVRRSFPRAELVANVDLGNVRPAENLKSMGFSEFEPSHSTMAASADSVDQRHQDVNWLKFSGSPNHSRQYVASVARLASSQNNLSQVRFSLSQSLSELLFADGLNA